MPLDFDLETTRYHDAEGFIDLSDTPAEERKRWVIIVAEAEQKQKIIQAVKIKEENIEDNKKPSSRPGVSSLNSGRIQRDINSFQFCFYFVYCTGCAPSYGWGLSHYCVDISNDNVLDLSNYIKTHAFIIPAFVDYCFHLCMRSLSVNLFFEVIHSNTHWVGRPILIGGGL